jgi:hypothetical protein
MTVAKDCGKTGFNDQRRSGRQKSGAGFVTKGKENTGILGGGTEHKLHLPAAVETDSRASHCLVYGGLKHCSSGNVTTLKARTVPSKSIDINTRF